jgi:hypothetical protein
MHESHHFQHLSHLLVAILYRQELRRLYDAILNLIDNIVAVVHIGN